MAGNTDDWTAEASSHRVTRGDDFAANSVGWYAGNRVNGNPTYDSWSDLNTRLALYIPVSNAVGADEYVKSGLILHLDGLDNTKNGHNNSTNVWGDLSGNNNNGTIKGASWLNDGLYFDGVDDWVPIKELNYPEFTAEVTFSTNKITTGIDSKIICNHDQGGFDICILSNSSNISSNPYISGQYRQLISELEIELNKKYNVTITTDGTESNLYMNGELVSNISIGGGVIGYPINNTVLALGVNPTGSSAEASFFNGAIYSVRMYNRALTEQEVKNNYEVDRLRFGE